MIFRIVLMLIAMVFIDNEARRKIRKELLLKTVINKYLMKLMIFLWIPWGFNNVIGGNVQ